MGLTMEFARRVKQPGRYGAGRNGAGLALLVQQRGQGGRLTKSWTQQIRLPKVEGEKRGKLLNIGLGSLERVTLAEASEAARENLRRVKRGQPVREPKVNRSSPLVPTLRTALEGWLDENAPYWKNARSVKDVDQRMKKHAEPILDEPVNRITRQQVREVLNRIERLPTRDRVFRWLGQVFNYAVGCDWIATSPVDKVLRQGLPKSKSRNHYEAIPLDLIPGVLAKVDEQARWKPLALAIRMVALTATRSGEVRDAIWEEFNLDQRVWTIPAERMKSDVAFRVPLSSAAIEVLNAAAEFSRGDGRVFPGALSSRGMDGGRLTEAIHKAGAKTIHGFRASFRTWTQEMGIQYEIGEMALAHTVGDKTVQAYARSDYFEARRALMEQWAAVVDGNEPQAEVIELATASA